MQAQIALPAIEYTARRSVHHAASTRGLKRLACLALLAISATGLSNVASAGDINIGRVGATVCAGCHGMDGISLIPGFPNLRGQDQTYLEAQLKNFRDESRTGGQSTIMYGMAAGLSDKDIENLAAYFSSLGSDGK